jgi:2,4-dienoyl-CoA reductase-like NADH-dependent reductase (Old Yellow Enzyme family)
MERRADRRKLQQINQFISGQNAGSGIQLAHAGRKASVSAPWNGNKKLDVTQGVGKLWLHQQ